MTESQSSATGTLWTRDQDKAFENALNLWHDESVPDRWEQVAALVPGGKDAAEVQRHYELLQEDVRLIEAGRVPLPNYSFASLSLSEDASDSPPGATTTAKKGHNAFSGSNGGGAKGVTASAKSADQERRKGIPWSEEEHRLFLLGLAKFGKGDWRSISRNFVISRTPTQVASHAQKYFIRLNSINKDKRRSSIHDITNVNNVGDGAMQQAQGPITGQPGPGAMYQQQQQPPPAVGAPVMLPPPGYGRPVMPPHMAYPMPQPGMHH